MKGLAPSACSSRITHLAMVAILAMPLLPQPTAIACPDFTRARTSGRWNSLATVAGMSPRCVPSNFWRTLTMRGRATSSPPAMFTSILSSIIAFSSGRLIVGHHVRPFGDYGQRVFAAAFDAVLQSFFDRVDQIDASERTIRRPQAAGIQMHSAGFHRLELHLRLPLVDVGKLLAADVGEKSFSAERDQAPLRVGILVRAESLGTLRHDQQIAAGFEDVDRSDHAFHRLVVRFVQGVAGGAGDDRLETPADRHACVMLRELDGLAMAVEDLAVIDERQPSMLVDDGVYRQHRPQHAHDLELLLVQRVAIENAVVGLGVRHETRAVEGRDGVPMRDARGDDLAPAGIAGHEMRFDQSGRDFQIGLDEAAIKFDRRSPRRAAEVDMSRVVAREVIHYAHGL